MLLVADSLPHSSSLSDDTFPGQTADKTDCDEAGDYAVPDVLSPRDYKTSDLTLITDIKRTISLSVNENLN